LESTALNGSFLQLPAASQAVQKRRESVRKCVSERKFKGKTVLKDIHTEKFKKVNGEEEEEVQKGLNNSLEKNSKRCEEVQNGVKKFKMVK
jgi:hypothetical protein